MTFWTGFATGLAKSVDQGLQKAMDKREGELSRAKTFWQTRQAQNLDMKEEYDRRAEKAMRRMIEEAGGDTTLALAAWNAAGGDADGNEKFLERLDKTRASKGKFKLTDAIIMPDDYVTGDNKYSSEDLIKSVGMNMPEFDKSRVSVSDFGKGTMFALRKDAGQQVADSLSDMTPEKVEQLTGIPKATLDMSNMLEAEKYAQDQKLIAKQLTPTLAESNASIVEEIMSLDPKADNFAEESARLIAKQEQVLTAIGDEAKAKDTSTTGSLTTSTLNTMYQQQLTANLVAKGINTKEQSYTDSAGNTIYGDGQGFIAALNGATNSFNNTFVNTLQRSDGSFGPAASTLISTNSNLKSVAARLSGDEEKDAGTTEAAPTVKVPKSIEEKDTLTKETFNTANAYVANVLQSVPKGKKVNPQKVFDSIMRIYKVSADEAQDIIDKAQEQKIKDDAKAQADLAAKPRYKTKADKLKEQELLKQQQQTQQSSEFSFNPEG